MPQIATGSSRLLRMPLIRRMSIPALIRTSYGILVALVLSLLVFSTFSMTQKANHFRDYLHKADRMMIMADVGEDLFEARVAVWQYRTTRDLNVAEEVASNIEEITSLSGVDGAFDTKGSVANPYEQLIGNLDDFSTGFETMVALDADIALQRAEIYDEGKRTRSAVTDMRAQAVQAGDIRAANIAGTIQEHVMLARFYAAQYADLQDPAQLARAEEELTRAQASLDRNRVALVANISAALLDKAEAGVAAMARLFPQMRASIEDRTQVLTETIDPKGLAVWDQVETRLNDLRDQQQSQGLQDLEEFRTIQFLGAVIGAGMILLAIAVALVVTVVVTRRIRALADTTDALVADNLDVEIEGHEREDETGRLARALIIFRDTRRERRTQQEIAQQEEDDRAAAVTVLSDSLANLASGDLGVRIQQQLAPGFEVLRQNFNTTVERLSHTVSGVIEQTENIRGGAGNLSSAADELARRTEGQAAALEETAATIVQLSDSVADTAQGAHKANSFVANAQQEAKQSLDVVASTVEAIRQIQSSSDEVAQIIGVIDDIAFQTNLLALNAGVEAARAGDAGQGFAVVASEVRALAQRASTAAKEIKDLIETSVVHVNEGVVRADQTGSALSKIADMVTEINDLVGTISAASTEQSEGLKEINLAVSQLDNVTQQNAAMVEETSAASHDLRRNSEELTQLTSAFRMMGAQKPGLAAPEDQLDNEWSDAVAALR